MRKLIIFWGFLDLCLLAAGVVSIVASVVFTMNGGLIMNLFFETIDNKLGIVLGGLYIFTVIISIPAILQPKERDILLKALIWVLLGISIVTLVIGTIIWVFSLQQLKEFSQIWGQQTTTAQQAIQDHFSCCGYWNGTTSGQFTANVGFCSNTTFAANQTGCQSFITSANSPGSDFTLNNLFTSVYGFEAIIICFFLATVCVINERKLEVRFEKIDEKRGGGGFV